MSKTIDNIDLDNSDLLPDNLLYEKDKLKYIFSCNKKSLNFRLLFEICHISINYCDSNNYYYN